MKKQRSPQKVVKNFKALYAEIERYNIRWCRNPLMSKFDECLYGEHVEGSVFMDGDDILDLEITKERSPQKVVKNLIALRQELMSHRQNYLLKSVVLKLTICLYGEYKLRN